MLQEHWLTPHNMYKFSTDFPGYYVYGSLAMEFTVQSEPLIGQPFGGTVTLIKNDLMPVCKCINASEQFVIVKLGDLVCINVYLLVQIWWLRLCPPPVLKHKYAC